MEFKISLISIERTGSDMLNHNYIILLVILIPFFPSRSNLSIFVILYDVGEQFNLAQMECLAVPGFLRGKVFNPNMQRTNAGSFAYYKEPFRSSDSGIQFYRYRVMVAENFVESRRPFLLRVSFIHCLRMFGDQIFRSLA